MEASLEPPSQREQEQEEPVPTNSRRVALSGGSCGHLVPPEGRQSVASWEKRAMSNLSLTDPTLLRGMPVARGLRNFGSVFSDRPPTAEYFEMSDQVTHVDTFVSHNWSTPRWKKFLVLIFHFNLRLALIVACLVGTVTCILTVGGLLPTITLPIPVVHVKEAETYTRGVLGAPLSLAAFILALLIVHELDRSSVSGKRHTIFLDKCCVHQVDLVRKELGIKSLAAFLKHSRHFLVLYSDAYMRQLWTIYEVASWFMLHKGTKLIQRPVTVPIVLIGGCSCFAALELLVFAMNVARLNNSLQPFVPYLLPVQFVLPVFATTAYAWLGARWAADCDRMESHVAEFSLSSARCHSEEDRISLQRNILAFMKFAELVDTEVGDEEVINAFEELVRREMPKLMRSSFGRVGVPYEWTLLAALPRVLVTFDLIAGDVVHGMPARHTLLGALHYLTVAVLVGPLLVAATFTATRYRRFRKAWAQLALGIGSGLLLSSSVVLLKTLTVKAEHSDRWIIALLVTYASLISTVCLVFRPL